MGNISGVCKYCMGCNKLEDINFKGIYRCKGFMPNQVKWEDIYRNEMRKK